MSRSRTIITTVLWTYLFFGLVMSTVIWHRVECSPDRMGCWLAAAGTVTKWGWYLVNDLLVPPPGQVYPAAEATWA